MRGGKRGEMGAGKGGKRNGSQNSLQNTRDSFNELIKIKRISPGE